MQASVRRLPLCQLAATAHACMRCCTHALLYACAAQPMCAAVLSNELLGLFMGLSEGQFMGLSG